MLNLMNDPSKNEKTFKRKPTSLLRNFIRSAGLFLFCLCIYQITVIILLRRPLQGKTSPFSGDSIQNPYEEKNWQNGGEKINIHAHSSDVWYTPERHTPTEIQAVYKEAGYSLISLTDYDQLPVDQTFPLLPGFEWGKNVKKRHALALGGHDIGSDFFPVYASRENISWTFEKMRERGSYVVIAHPKLYNAFSAEDLETIPNYQAIEVYSPYGDDHEILDRLLSKGRLVHCMSSDDMHYFSESQIKSFNQPLWKDILQTIFLQRGRDGESLQRYIATAKGRNDAKAVREDLETGAFYCVKKFFREADDPVLPNIILDKNSKINLTSTERYLEIRWIGQNGEMKKIDSSNNISSYQLDEKDSYIRLEIIALTGSILSNAIYRDHKN